MEDGEEEGCWGMKERRKRGGKVGGMRGIEGEILGGGGVEIENGLVDGLMVEMEGKGGREGCGGWRFGRGKGDTDAYVCVRTPYSEGRLVLQ